MEIGSRMMIPSEQAEGVVVDVKGKFIGFRIDGRSSTIYWTEETVNSWKYTTPDQPPRVIECPPAPKVSPIQASFMGSTCPGAPRKVKPSCEIRGILQPRRLVF